MSSLLLFVPATAHTWQATLAAEVVEAFAATAALREALGYRADQDEDAEHAAMVLASVAGLATHGERFVVACEVPSEAVSIDDDHPDTANGRVRTSSVPTSRVVSWFTEEPGVDGAAAASAASGRSLDEAWETPEVAALIAEHALLWHAAEELSAAPAKLHTTPNAATT